MAELAGRPLLDHTLEPALRRAIFGRIVVSTDDPAVAARAAVLGATPPFERPSALSGDRATNVDVCLHALEWFRTTHDLPAPTLIVLLQVTSPFRPWSDCEAVIHDMLGNENLVSTIAVLKAAGSATDLFLRSNDAGLSPLVLGSAHAGQTTPLFAPCGALYAIRTAMLIEHHSFTPPGTRGLEVDRLSALDIDTRDDLEFARMVAREAPQRLGVTAQASSYNARVPK